MNLKIIAVATGIILLGIQFIPYGKDHINPKVVSEPKWDSPKTRELFMKACADCHSNESKYPIYSNVAPISWLVEHDIQEGRSKFNISMWGSQTKNEGEDAAEEIVHGEMPMSIYVLMHKEADLSKEEKQVLIDGLEKTFGKDD
jgi:hypothetical protein